MSHTTSRFIIVALLIIIAVLAFQTCARNQDRVEVLKKVTVIQHDSIKYFVDKAGSEHAQKTMAEAEIAILKTTYKQQIDSLQSRLDIQASQIQSVTSISTKTEGHIIPVVDTFIQTDTSRNFDFHYSDAWLQMRGRIGTNAFVFYKMRDSLIASVYFKRKNWLSKKQLYLDAFSLNPNAEITGLTGYKVPYKMPGRWGIGPYAGLSYLNQRLYPSFGVAIQYAFIQF